MKFKNQKQEQDQNAEFKAQYDNDALSAARAKPDTNTQPAAKSQPTAKAKSAAKDFVTDSTFKADPFGSYTGHSKDEGETPAQDADDL